MKAAAVFLLVLGCLAATHAWTCKEAPRLHNAQQVDAGMGQVVGVDKYRRVYYLSGTYWYTLGTTSLKHVSTGPTGTWGCDSTNKLYKYIAGNFKVVSGLTMLQVDAGGESQVAALRSSNNYTYCMTRTRALYYDGAGSPSWSYQRMILMYISCGLNICWGVSKTNKVYATKVSTSATSCSFTRWYPVGGLSLKMVEIATDGSVFGVTTTGKVYQRYGVRSTNHLGSSWREIPMCMPIKHVSYDLKHLWVVTESHLLLVCTP